jgi:excisionase family DNA binding protein
MQDTEADLLMTGAVAQLLKVSETRVRQLEQAGAIRALRTSDNRRLFRRRDVLELAQQRALVRMTTMRRPAPRWPR